MTEAIYFDLTRHENVLVVPVKVIHSFKKQYVIIKM